MPSVFDLFGTLNLETRAFENSVKTVEARLKSADSALDATIARSNKLGDTSATVARRYEKLSENIAAQRQKLLDNALAFEKGEITGQKFSSILTSVDKATAGLNAKLRDTKARLTELDETGLTHFQQQIEGAIQSAQSKLEAFRKTIAVPPPPTAPPSTDLLKNTFSNLSGFQKQQLSFQLNDIVTGLASGQDPLRIIAQQAGQVVQIFQQGKVAQEGVAAATTTAATAQAAFAASTTTAATSQAAVAASSAATAASTEAAAASATILGASVGTLAGLLSAGAIAIFTVYKVTQQIEDVAKQRLALEEKITSEYSKQNILAASLDKARQEALERRNLNALISEGSPEAIAARRDQLELQQQAAVAEADELRRRQQAVGDADSKARYSLPIIEKLIPPTYAKKLVDDLATQAAAAEEKARTFTDRILQLDQGVIDAKQRRADADVEITKFAERTKFEVQSEANQRAFDEQRKLEEKKKELVKKAIEDAKKFAEQVKQAGEAVRGIFSSTSDNPFTKIFLDGESAVQKMREATKGLGSDLQNTLAGLLNNQTATKAFVQQMDNALKSLNLRRDAGRFIPNNLSKLSDSDFLQKQLNAIGAGGPITQYFNPEKLAQIDKKIIALTANADPSKLTYSQNKLASDARLREADRTDKAEAEDREIRRQLLNVLRQLNGNKALEIEITDQNQRTAIGATSSNVNARYSSGAGWSTTGQVGRH